MPFRGSGPALQALIGGQVDYVCDQTVGIVPSIQGGLVKGLAIATPVRSPVLPDVPTSQEQGLPQFRATGWNLILAPKVTPNVIVDQLNAALNAVISDSHLQERFADLGAPVPTTPARFGKLVIEEKWAKVGKFSGASAE